VARDPEIFLAFGQVGKTGPIEFGLEKITLLEAVGKAGGLMNSSADPGAFFVFRYEPASAVRQMKPDYNGRFGDKVPVVYRINLREPNAFFFAKSFRVRDRDLLYVATAPFTELQKFLQIISTTTSLAQPVVTYEQLTRP
jgi:polysaccharide export outer membrane protein